MATCWKCGTELQEGAQTCASCGVPVAPQPDISAPPPISPQSEHERKLALFVGDKYPVYARKWARMREKGRAISWNWATAFLFVGWLGYRGLYRIAGHENAGHPARDTRQVYGRNIECSRRGARDGGGKTPGAQPLAMFVFTGR